MPSIYSDWEYAESTKLLAESFPKWTQIRKNPESLGHQILNVLGQELDRTKEAVDDTLSHRLIGLADPNELFQAYKGVLPSNITKDTKITSIKNGETSLTESYTLYNFYTNNGDGSVPDKIIFDFENRVCYTRKKYTGTITITVNSSGAVINLVPHHIWDPIDDFALILGLRRRYRESVGEYENNVQLLDRILYVFKFIGNSTKSGLLNGIGQYLGLVNKETWAANTPTFKTSIVPVGERSITIDGKLVQPGQYAADLSLKTSLTVFPRKDFTYETMNLDVDIDTSDILVTKGANTGWILTPILDPGNLQNWSKLNVTTVGDPKVEVYDGSYRGETNAEDYILASGNLSNIIITSVTSSIRLKIYLDKTQSIQNLSLDYVNLDSQVEYIHSLKIDALYDSEFKKTLFDQNDMPTNEMKKYVDQINKEIPIMWDQFKWDESFWNVVDDDIIGFDVIPHNWDPDLNAVLVNYPGIYQTGVGDLDDLLVKPLPDSWKIRIHNGYYYINSSLDEFYLHSNNRFDTTVVGTVDSQDLGITLPKQVSNIYVSDLNGSSYDEVFFLTKNDLTDDYVVTLENVISFDIDTSKSFLFDENNIILISVNNQTPDTYGATVSGNKVTLETLPEGNTVEFKYRVQHSFIYKDGKLYFSEPITNPRIVYETQDTDSYYNVDHISLDPVINPIRKGFIYLTNQKTEPTELSIQCDPDILMISRSAIPFVDRQDVATIIVDVFDVYGNPVFGYDVVPYDIPDTEIEKVDVSAISCAPQYRTAFRFAPDYKEMAAGTKETRELTFRLKNGLDFVLKDGNPLEVKVKITVVSVQ